MRQQSRRLKIVTLSENAVLYAFLTNPLDESRMFSVPIIKDLPEDAVILGVHHEWQYKAFCFTVKSESFEEVPDGERIPNWHRPGEIEYKSYCLVDRDEFEEWRAWKDKAAMIASAWTPMALLSDEDRKKIDEELRRYRAKNITIVPSNRVVAIAGEDIKEEDGRCLMTIINGKAYKAGSDACKAASFSYCGIDHAIGESYTAVSQIEPDHEAWSVYPIDLSIWDHLAYDDTGRQILTLELRKKGSLVCHKASSSGTQTITAGEDCPPGIVGKDIAIVGDKAYRMGSDAHKAALASQIETAIVGKSVIDPDNDDDEAEDDLPEPDVIVETPDA